MPPPRKRSPRPYPQPIRRPKVAGTTNRSDDAASASDALDTDALDPNTLDPNTLDTEQADTSTQRRGFDLVTGVDLAQDDATTESANGAGQAGDTGTDIGAANAAEKPARQVSGMWRRSARALAGAGEDGPDNGGATRTVGTAQAPGTGEVAERTSRTGEAAARESRKVRIAATLAVLALVLGGLAFWFSVEAADARGGNAGNTALSDAATTKAVQEQVSNDLNAVMSYDYKHPDRTTKAAKDVLGDDTLAKDYSQIINVLEANGVKQQLSLSTKVMTSGVEQLRGDRAVVLVLASQTYTKGGDPRPSATTARLRVNAERHGDRWRITGLKQY